MKRIEMTASTEMIQTDRLKNHIDMALEEDAELLLPTGEIGIEPGNRNLSTIVVPNGKTLAITGRGREVTRIKRYQNDSWGFRFRLGNGARLLLNGIAFDGNKRGLPSESGQDQHHAVRVDSLQAGNVSPLVDFRNCGSYDQIADCIQIVHNGIEQFVVDNYRFMGGSKGRRCIQLSYHPKNTTITNSIPWDLSSEIAGGQTKRSTMVMTGTRVLGNLNFANLGHTDISGCYINTLSHFTPISGGMSRCTIERFGSLAAYRQCNATFDNCDFLMRRDRNSTQSVNVFNYWPRFSTHDIRLKFKCCRIHEPEYPMDTFIRGTQFGESETPYARIDFEDMEFGDYFNNSAITMKHGADWRIKRCHFKGPAFNLQPRFYHGSMIEETGNSFEDQEFVYGNQESQWSPFWVLSDQTPGIDWSTVPGFVTLYDIGDANDRAVFYNQRNGGFGPSPGPIEFHEEEADLEEPPEVIPSEVLSVSSLESQE